MYETQTITVSIDGVQGSTRQVQARVWLSGDNVRASLLEGMVLCKFPTGTKLHRDLPQAWKQEDGSFRISSRAVIHNRTCRVIGWETERREANSGWTGEKK